MRVFVYQLVIGAIASAPRPIAIDFSGD